MYCFKKKTKQYVLFMNYNANTVLENKSKYNKKNKQV